MSLYCLPQLYVTFNSGLGGSEPTILEIYVLANRVTSSVKLEKLNILFSAAELYPVFKSQK